MSQYHQGEWAFCVMGGDYQSHAIALPLLKHHLGQFNQKVCSNIQLIIECSDTIIIIMSAIIIVPDIMLSNFIAAGVTIATLSVSAQSSPSGISVTDSPLTG